MPHGETLIYGSVCSGIEAATAAWHPLGWRPAFFSEIEPFPRAVLQHHYPETPLHGDFTTIKENDYAAIDLLVGGTPCQAFSVAGLRKGFADERGNLTLEFVRLAQRLNPRWLVWENVPGVLSIDGGRAFGSFLGGLAELGYGFAYRVLDAQHFGVPQRRRRVFVVGYLGDWRPAAAVLFERESLLRDLTPRRETWEKPAPTISARTKGGGGLGSDFDLDGGLITHSLRAEGFDASEDGTGRGTPLVPVAFPERLSGTQCVRAENLSSSLGSANPTAVAIPINMQAAAKNGKKSPNMLGIGKDGDPSPTLGANDIHAVAFDLRGREEGAMLEGPHDTANIRAATGGSSRSYVTGFADVSQPVRSNIHNNSDPGMEARMHIQHGMQVRRLTPRECERLQGFEDDFTLVPFRGKPAADGPRYRTLGNSMAVPCMSFLGRRIQMVESLIRASSKAA